jgi:small subunit ribosomal protein S19e
LTTAYDVPADVLIGRITDYIKGNVREITPPEWAAYVKTGSHVERAPQDPDWWYVRTASMLRKLYMKGPVGVSRLRKDYGGRKRRGVRPAHFARAGGKIIRSILQQLETAGLVEKANNGGRVVSAKGRSLLDAMSGQIKREMDRERPELKEY